MKNPNLFLVGSVVLILLAVALVAILDRTSSKNGEDVRARASAKTTTALQLAAEVVSVDEKKGTITVGNTQFSQKSLAGTAKNLGSYVVTTPSGFNYASVSPGTKVVMNIDSTTFQVTNHTITALTIVPGQ